METLLLFLGVLVLVPIIVLYSSFSWGYVATIFWGWFIIPLFPDLHSFTWIQFAGIMFLVNCFTSYSKIQIKDEYKDNVVSWTQIILAPWLTLLGGWILHLFY